MGIKQDEYTNLTRRSAELKQELKNENQKIGKVISVLHKIVTEDPFERRLRGESAERLFESTGVKELDYPAIKQKMLELVEINLRLKKLREQTGRKILSDDH